MEHDTFVKLIYEEFISSRTLTDEGLKNLLMKAYPGVHFPARYTDAYPSILTFKYAILQLNYNDGKIDLEGVRVLWTALRPVFSTCCAHVFKSGCNKGARCPKAIGRDGEYCNAHSKSIPKCSESEDGKPCKRKVYKDGKCSLHFVKRCSHVGADGTKCRQRANYDEFCYEHYRPPPRHEPPRAEPRSTEQDTHPLASEVKRILNTPLYSLFTGSAEAIRKEYKRLALIFHPDKCDHPKASEVFGKIAMAYEKVKR